MQVSFILTGCALIVSEVLPFVSNVKGILDGVYQIILQTFQIRAEINHTTTDDPERQHLLPSPSPPQPAHSGNGNSNGFTQETVPKNNTSSTQEEAQFRATTTAQLSEISLAVQNLTAEFLKCKLYNCKSNDNSVYDLAVS